MTVEDGTGLPDADSYVDPEGAFATAYVAGHLYAETWTTATAPKRQTAILHATRTLDALYEWNGKRLNGEQALGFPRTGIRIDGYDAPPLPKPIKEAAIELAIALLERNRLSDTSSGTQGLEKLELGSGALVLDFGTDPTAMPTPAGQMIPPYVRRLLREYGFTGGGGMTKTERR